MDVYNILLVVSIAYLIYVILDKLQKGDYPKDTNDFTTEHYALIRSLDIACDKADTTESFIGNVAMDGIPLQEMSLPEGIEGFTEGWRNRPWRHRPWWRRPYFYSDDGSSRYEIIA